jgi:hypothetical protein
MLQFFRINVPDRLLGLFVILLLVRLPFFLYGAPLTMPELVWQITGEKLNAGSLLYRDVWTELAPIPAYSYAILDSLFGKSRLPYYLVATVLTYLQAIMVYRISIRTDIFLERTYIPALVYILISSWFFEFLTLSPALMATTFLIAVFGKTIRHIREPLAEDEILIMGSQVGVAALCYLPSLLFILVPIVAFLLYSGTTARQYALIIFGLVLPFSLVYVYYFWFDNGTDFYYNFILASFTLPSVSYLGFQTILLIFSVPALLFLAGNLAFLGAARITNYQQICRVIVLFNLIAGLLAALLTTGKSAAPYFLMVPGISYFVTWLFLLQKKADIAEGTFFIFMVFSITFLYIGNYANRYLGPLFRYEKLVVGQQMHPGFVQGKRILVIGEDLSWYHKNSLATPYLNRRLAERHFGHLDEFKPVESVFGNFGNDYPEFIVNEDGTLDSLFNRMPILKARYIRSKDPKIFTLKSLP